jgi:hypothetical protein
MGLGHCFVLFLCKQNSNIILLNNNILSIINTCANVGFGSVLSGLIKGYKYPHMSMLNCAWIVLVPSESLDTIASILVKIKTFFSCWVKWFLLIIP